MAKKGKIEASDARIIRIGRQPYCEVTLDPYQDIPASGEHARIVCQPDGTFTLSMHYGNRLAVIEATR